MRKMSGHLCENDGNVCTYTKHKLKQFALENLTHSIRMGDDCMQLYDNLREQVDLRVHVHILT